MSSRLLLPLMVMTIGGSLQAAEIGVYPVDPGEGRDAPYRLMADATEIPLERVGVPGGKSDGVFYGRCTGVATIRVAPAARGKIEAQVEPARLAQEVAVGEEALTFTVSEPGARIIQMRLDGKDLPRLLLIVDPAETFVPDPAKQKVIRVEDHGAVADQDAVQTSALQAALDACAATPQTGYVVVPKGRFVTGTLTIRDNTFLYLSPGAVLAASSNPADFPVDAGRREQGGNGRTHSFSRVLFFDHARHAGLIGRGTVDGNGLVLRNQRRRPIQLIDAHDCEDITLEGVVLRNPASWTCHLVHSTNVKVRDVKIIADWAVKNTDGIDPDMCCDVLIERVLCYTGDDCIAVKTTGNSGFLRDCTGIRIRDSVMMTRKTALKIGTETLADIRDVVFENIDCVQSSRGIALWVHDGGQVADITFKNIRMSLVEIAGEKLSGMPFMLTLEERFGKGSTLRDVTFKDVVCEAPYKSVLANSSPQPMQRITFENIVLKVTPRKLKPEKAWLFEIEHAKEVAIRDLTVDWSQAGADEWLGLWPEEFVALSEGIVEKGRK